DRSQSIKRQGFSTAAIQIGRNCWIGSQVTILKGVTIGDNSIIGAGVVVYQDVPENSIILSNGEIRKYG
ncbi:MAG: DapH/DapD/GlmU-related protein, partial [Lactococcus lactis]|nr:DapH/DapD/GlmU-related protein [Lactococcus lactis]